MRGQPEEGRTADASKRTLEMADHRRGESRIHEARRSSGKAAETVPDAAALAILRNPIDRAHPHFHLNTRNGRESRAFADAIRLGLKNPLYLELTHPIPVSGDGFRIRYAYLGGGHGS